MGCKKIKNKIKKLLLWLVLLAAPDEGIARAAARGKEAQQEAGDGNYRTFSPLENPAAVRALKQLQFLRLMSGCRQ